MIVIDTFIPITYLIISLILGRQNRLFYLIFPFALYQGPGAFIDPQTALKIFTEAYRINDVILAYLVIIVMRNNYLKLNVIIKLQKSIYFLIILIGIIIFLSFIKGSSPTDILTSGRIIIYPVIFFLLITKLMYQCSQKDLYEFSKVMLIVCMISSILYILNSSDILRIFPYELYSDKVKLEVTRDFATMPILLPLFLPFTIVLYFLPDVQFNRKLLVGLFILFLIVIFFSYTRALILIVSVIFSASSLMVIVKKRNGVNSLSKIFILFLCILPLIYLMSSTFMKEQAYFIDRLEEFIGGGYYSTPNLVLRANYVMLSLSRLVAEGNILFGLGLQKFENLNKLFTNLYDWETDTMWGWYIVTTGIIGSIIVVVLFITSMLSKYIQFLKSGYWIYLWCGTSLSFLFIFSFSSNIMLKPLIVIFPFAISFMEKNRLWKKNKQVL